MGHKLSTDRMTEWQNDRHLITRRQVYNTSGYEPRFNALQLRCATQSGFIPGLRALRACFSSACAGCALCARASLHLNYCTVLFCSVQYCTIRTVSTLRACFAHVLLRFARVLYRYSTVLYLRCALALRACLSSVCVVRYAARFALVARFTWILRTVLVLYFLLHCALCARTSRHYWLRKPTTGTLLYSTVLAYE